MIKTVAAFVALGVIGLYLLLYVRRKHCDSLVNVGSGNSQNSYLGTRGVNEWVCGVAPPVGPHVNNPAYATTDEGTRLCEQLLGMASAIRAGSQDPRVQLQAEDAVRACSVASELKETVTGLFKGAKSLGGVFN